MIALLGKRTKAKQSPAPQNDGSKNRARLGVEQMEDRSVPANLVLEVTTLADEVDPDDGVFSLRERIAEANGEAPTSQHRIFFNQTLWGGTITLNPNLSQLDLSKSIFIDGPANKITVQRDPEATRYHRLFEVHSTSTSTLARLKLLHGEEVEAGELGGAVLSRGSLTVDSCEIRENQSAERGGGIAATSGSLDILNSAINGNHAALGGGIHIGYGVYANIRNSVIGLNHATELGGGIYITPSTDSNQPTNVTLNAVEVVGNIAMKAGGGIFADTSTQGWTALTLTNNTNIHENIVQAPFDPQMPFTGKGGGLYFGNGILTLAGVTFANNEAAQGDGMYRVQGQTTLAPNPVAIWINDQDALGPP